jgi:hypothetical protein
MTSPEDAEMAAIMEDSSLGLAEKMRRKQDLINKRFLAAAEEDEEGEENKVRTAHAHRQAARTTNSLQTHALSACWLSLTARSGLGWSHDMLLAYALSAEQPASNSCGHCGRRIRLIQYDRLRLISHHYASCLAGE